MINKIKEFIVNFNEVFDESHKVKLCGREKCKNLIYSCDALGNKELGYYGNRETGMMDVNHILELYAYITG